MEISITRFGMPKKLDSCLICLPGRGGGAMQMTKDYQEHLEILGHRESAVVGMQPKSGGWYPIPNGPEDSQDAIDGLKEGVSALGEAITKIEEEYNISKDKIMIAGFSAGAVMAIQVAANSEEPFAGIISHSGAILDPDNLPSAPNETPLLLCHYKDDKVFKWDERYLPMKEALDREGYKVDVWTSPIGGHKIDHNRPGGFVLEKLRFNR